VSAVEDLRSQTIQTQHFPDPSHWIPARIAGTPPRIGKILLVTLVLGMLRVKIASTMVTSSLEFLEPPTKPAALVAAAPRHVLHKTAPLPFLVAATVPANGVITMASIVHGTQQTGIVSSMVRAMLVMQAKQPTRPVAHVVVDMIQTAQAQAQ
jgi:hypothetical protein